ncbi:MAG TPA: DNA/RNA non-specific endonuclease [Chryseolinea sp.]
MNISLELLDRYAKENTTTEQDVKDTLETVKAGTAETLDTPEQRQLRIRMLASVAVEPYADAVERYVEGDDLLPVNYMELGVLRSRSVGRIFYRDTKVNRNAYATGFLISNHLVMTNHHVFSEPSGFANPIIEFDYEYDVFGREKTKITFDLDADKFFYSNKELDMAIIGIKEKDVTGIVDVRSRGYLVLNGTKGKIGMGDFAAIFQHPDGKPMMVGLRENKIINVDDPTFLEYTTDTSVGSSGGPVTNDQWQVIALHSAGVGKKNAKEQYIDKDGVVIPPNGDGTIDGNRVVWIKNKGTRISAIMNHVMTSASLKSNAYILELFSPSYSDDKNLVFLSYPKEKPSTSVENKGQETQNNVQPAPQNVHIHINLAGGAPAVVTSVDGSGAAKLGVSMALETKFEDELDFSGCNGFDTYFLGEHTPMPKLSAALKKKVAYFVNNPRAFVLKYHHYSCIQHAVRRQPVVSAINITGRKRYEELQGRDDKWFRDNRIDYEVQLSEEYYKLSGFDRGHMCRREDAEWGQNLNAAKLAADMTCAYTNACPQVPALNREGWGYHGKWGQLEKEILEKGVKAVGENQPRIVVFNGPIFHEDDPVFKGVQVPMSFFKIIVWRNPAGDMKTTGFILKQDQLVGDINFELAYDDVFKTLQSSVANIESQTGLTFAKIKAWDTFSPNNGNGPDEHLLVDTHFENLVLADTLTQKYSRENLEDLEEPEKDYPNPKKPVTH